MSEKKELRVKNTPPFKLKDRQGKSWQAIDLKKQFGFIPEVIIVEKVPRMNNALIIRAILTEEEIKREENLKASMTEENKKVASK